MIVDRNGRKECDFAGIPMWVANCCGVQMTQGHNIHFIDAVKLALRVILSNNSAAYNKEIEKKENEDGIMKLFTVLEEQQKKRQNFNRCMTKEGDSLNLATE